MIANHDRLLSHAIEYNRDSCAFAQLSGTLEHMPRISVVLDKETHKLAKRTADDCNPPLTLMQYVANLIKEDLARRGKRSAA